MHSSTNPPPPPPPSSSSSASNTPYDLIPMSGGSDYLSFIQQGVDIPGMRLECLCVCVRERERHGGIEGGMGGGGGGGRREGMQLVLLCAPAGGVATGAGGLKTVEERCKYGGLADAQLDTCYHQVGKDVCVFVCVMATRFQSCDTIDNVDAKVYVQMAGTIAHALEVCVCLMCVDGTAHISLLHIDSHERRRHKRLP